MLATASAIVPEARDIVFMRVLSRPNLVLHFYKLLNNMMWGSQSWLMPHTFLFWRQPKHSTWVLFLRLRRSKLPPCIWRGFDNLPTASRHLAAQHQTFANERVRGRLRKVCGISQSWLQPPFEAAPRSTAETDRAVARTLTSNDAD